MELAAATLIDGMAKQAWTVIGIAVQLDLLDPAPLAAGDAISHNHVSLTTSQWRTWCA